MSLGMVPTPTFERAPPAWPKAPILPNWADLQVPAAWLVDLTLPTAKALLVV